METSATSPETFYYFCVSGSTNVKSQEKQYVFYTEIKEISCEEPEIKTISKKWKDYIKRNCENSSGCTSDLNYYRSVEKAKNAYEKSMTRYSDSAKFITARVKF